MNWPEKYNDLNNKERDEFRRVVNRLIGDTFLVRNDENRHDFWFVEKHSLLIEEYLTFMGWNLLINKAEGVVQAINREGWTKLNLSMWDSILLLLLRLMYEEKQKQINIGEIIGYVHEFQSYCLSFRLTKNGVLPKKYLTDAFRIFKRFSLVKVLDSDVTDQNCRFIIFPSIKYAVAMDSIETLYSSINAYPNERENELETTESN
ncbi:DUF4194 domain-containing protein [Brevibacillus antibioticus]|uniref:DUF4194 domain-containing protein n=1 Tax=Brevibacillus antibioticus TaxID=2570228 RepID=UPI0013904F95|nr:DUF4194 domain-containing protein [Brevibacillus antibioticus]